MKRIKSFQELNNLVKRQEYQEFVDADIKRKCRILNSHGIKHGGLYSGIYDSSSDSIVIKSINNPFISTHIKAKIAGPKYGLKDKQKRSFSKLLKGSSPRWRESKRIVLGKQKRLGKTVFWRS